MSGVLAGKIAIITGASQGAGRGWARAMAQAGATVIAVSRSMKLQQPGEAPAENTLAGLAHEAQAAGEDIRVMSCDVGDEAQIVRCVEEVVANFGRIDIIVSNAATYPEDQAAPHYDKFGISTAEWERYIRVNVTGPYHFIRAAAPHMIAQGSGHIVNVTSLAGVRNSPFKSGQEGMIAYATSKAALNRMSQFFALELEEYGISVNALCPGMVVTNSWRNMDAEKRDQMIESGLAKPPTAEAMGPALLYLLQQGPEVYSGQVLSTDAFGKEWP